MSTPDFKHAFETWHLRSQDEIRSVLNKTIVKIIEHRPEKCQQVMESAWVQELLAEGIDVSLLTNPCILERVPNAKQKQSISTPEIQHAFSENQWKKVMNELPGGACAISNIRALNEALVQNPKAELIITVEGDVEPTKNAHQLFASLLPQFHLNPAMQECVYISLSFSNWHAGHDKKVRTKSKMVKDSKMEPYFSIQTIPMSKTYSGKYRYEFIGQGSRALAFRRSFAETLVNTRIENWYDLHIMSHLSWMNEKAWYNGSWIQNLACLVDPPIFSHEPSFSDRFRDSGRLKALASTTAEEHSYYICVDFSKHEWGFCNRAQTLALVGGFASLMRYGLYVCWPIKEATTNSFEELIKINTDSVTSSKIPFIHVYSNPNDKSWLHAWHHKTWCRGHFESQCEVDVGLDHFFADLEKKAMQANKQEL